jgi:hypothetical protein
LGIVRSYSGAPATPQQRNTEPRSANDLDYNVAFGINPNTRRPFSSNPGAPLNTVGFVQPDGSLARGRALSHRRTFYGSTTAMRLRG